MKSFNQGSTLPADFTHNYIKDIGELSRFFVRPVCVRVSPGGCLFVFFVDFGSPGDHVGGHVGVLEHPEAPKGHAMDPKMPPGEDLENL